MNFDDLDNYAKINGPHPAKSRREKRLADVTKPHGYPTECNNDVGRPGEIMTWSCDKFTINEEEQNEFMRQNP